MCDLDRQEHVLLINRIPFHLQVNFRSMVQVEQNLLSNQVIQIDAAARANVAA